jgi:hypothetical protein
MTSHIFVSADFSYMRPEVEFLIEVRTRECTILAKCVRQNIHMEGEKEDLL